jgi:CDGSH-type Zn-finger protein
MHDMMSQLIQERQQTIAKIHSRCSAMKQQPFCDGFQLSFELAQFSVRFRAKSCETRPRFDAIA